MVPWEGGVQLSNPFVSEPTNTTGITRAGTRWEMPSRPVLSRLLRQLRCVVSRDPGVLFFFFFCEGGTSQSICNLCTPEGYPVLSSSLCPSSVWCPSVFLTFPESLGNVLVLQFSLPDATGYWHNV